MTNSPWRICAAAALLVAADTSTATAHGIVGARFFPATIATDDPFAADELALPTITAMPHETDYDLDYSKTILPGFALGFGAGYVEADPPGGPKASGFTNVSVTPLIELIRDRAHETILSAGFIWEIGGSGSKAVADRPSTYTPELLFGRGFGDLPDSVAPLRPFAVTGQIGFQIPGTSTASKAVEWGGAIEYSLLYLQNQVRDQGFTTFVAHLTPFVEFSFESPTDRGGGGTTGSINPGIVWSGQYVQLAVEAVIPVNGSSGDGPGAMAQLHFYLDDIFPDSFGLPILGDTP